MQKICAGCSTAFTAYHINRHKFCSAACRQKASRPKAKRAWTRRAGKECEGCKAPFLPATKAARFCSRACLYTWLTGPTSPSWKGGRITGAEGYVRVMCKGHPKADPSGYVSEHRLVMEKSLGRQLEDHETVHHINGVRADNRVENLQLRSGRHGIGVVHVCADCGSHNIISEKLACPSTPAASV